MKIFVFADAYYENKIPDIQPDLVLLLGDLRYRDILRIDHKYKCLKIGVLGNHEKPKFGFFNTFLGENTPNKKTYLFSI